MSLTVYIAHAAAGCFLVNGIPHFVQGLSGHQFQSPFAKPPGIGESSPVVNILWGAFNLVLGAILLCGVGEFKAGANIDTFVSGGFALATALVLGKHFGKIRSGG